MKKFLKEIGDQMLDSGCLSLMLILSIPLSLMLVAMWIERLEPAPQPLQDEATRVRLIKLCRAENPQMVVLDKHMQLKRCILK